MKRRNRKHSNEVGTLSSSNIASSRPTEFNTCKGQVLLEVVRCGICGSDLHMQHHCDHMHDLTARVGFNGLAKSTDPFVLGHEFCGKVLDYGPKHAINLKPTHSFVQCRF